jgi:hypothetical protein
MKKVMFLLLGTVLTVGAMAQTVPTQTTPTKKAAEKAMVHDVKELKDNRKDRNTKFAQGKFRAAKQEQKHIKAHRKHLNANKKHLRNKGVETPVENAKAKVNN